MTAIVCNIDFYCAGVSLPRPLTEEATRQGFTVPEGTLVAVRTLVDSHGPGPISYQFDRVGNSPREIKAYMHRLAVEDGADLNEVAKRAFADDRHGA